MLRNNSYYGGFDTLTFSEVWPTADDFMDDWAIFKTDCQLFTLADADVRKSYFILGSEYAFSHHIGSKDQWKFMMFMRISEYLPYLLKDIQIQTALLGMNLDELREGSKAIYNSALNPGTSPTTGSMRELDYINSQNTTNYKKSKVDAWASLIQMLDSDLVKNFLNKFKNLFVKTAYPDWDLYYINNLNDYELNEGD